MNSFNFKSSVCTSREQSERLLALGLKKETADCCYYYYDGEYLIAFAEDAKYPSDIPAWSLHRLIEMIDDECIVHLKNFTASGVVYYKHESLFDNIIDYIECKIKKGYFSKEYLV